MAFDPTAYLSKKSPGFDPGAYLAKKNPRQDMGPNARSAMMLRGMRPEPAPDEVSSDLHINARDLNRTLQGRPDVIGTPESRAAENARHSAEDPLQNDPLAAAIVQGIPAAGLGTVVAGATGVPVLGQAAAGAVMDPEHPARAAALNMIPGLPGAVKQADNAIGRAALHAPSLVPAGKAAGAAAGTYLGHRAGGFVGAGVGAGIGAKVGGKLGGLADRGVEALGDRYLARTSQFPRPVTYEPPTFPSPAEPAGGPIIDPEIIQTPSAPGSPRQLGPMSRLAPLEPQPTAPPKYRPGTFGEQTYDEFGHPLTRPGAPATNTPTRGEGTAVLTKPAEDIGHMKTEIAKQAKAFRDAPPEVQPETGPSLEEQLARSVKILDDLKIAAKNGTLTPEMEQAAVNAGIPPANVSRAIGRTSAATSENPIAKSRRDQIRRDAKNARILSGRND